MNKKILDTKKISEKLKVDRRLIFTHGSFDLFHIGHMSMLEESKKLGGKLVVGVDHDDSIKTYKSSSVVFHQDYRVSLIARLDFVDYVIPLPSYEIAEDADYYFLKTYLMLKPSFVTFGSNFPFIPQAEEKCRLAGAKARKILHAYSTNVSTTKYAFQIVRNFINDDKRSYSQESDQRNI